MNKGITFLQETLVSDGQQPGENVSKLNFRLRHRMSTESVVTGNVTDSKPSLINVVIYSLARSLVAIIQILPLPLVARLGRAGGGLAFNLTARYRRVALDNLKHALPEKSAMEIKQIAHEHFRRLGENYASAIKTSFMTPEQMRSHIEFVGAEKLPMTKKDSFPQSRVVAIGHFGNFELYARVGQFVPVRQVAATYRGLNQPALNRLLVALRNRSGCRFYERRAESAELRTEMNNPGVLLGLLADQHAGDNGLRTPFFGRDCSTSTAPAIFALRYNCPLNTAICYRVGLGRWRIEVGEEIPTRTNDEPRPIIEIMRDVNRSFEDAIRRDPANWFWVHRRWKSVELKPKNIRQI
jgi:lauroyl/myristoyl acyltransferase